VGIDKKVAILSDAVMVLHKYVLNSSYRLNKQMVKDREKVTSLQEKVTRLESSQLRHDRVIRELHNHIKTIKLGSMDGMLFWKIADVGAKMRQAKDGAITCVYSSKLMTIRYFYKLCARLYFNGHGMGKGTHVSLFLVLLRVEYDALRLWPFRQKVTLMLIDQACSHHHQDTFQPDMASSSFARSMTVMIIASACPLYIAQSGLVQ
jgi:hypothetical protein